MPQPATSSASLLSLRLLYAAYGWLLLSGVLHFAIDVVSQVLRGRRAPSPTTTLYYGLNSTYALSQILFALLALLAVRGGSTAMGRSPGLLLGFVAAAAWLCICFLFLEYPQPRATIAVFIALLLGVALTR